MLLVHGILGLCSVDYLDPPNVDLERLLNISLVPVPKREQEAMRWQQLVNLDPTQLMKHDSLAHLIPGTTHLGRTPSTYEPPPDSYVTAARAAVCRKLSGTLVFPNAPEEVPNVVHALAIGNGTAVSDNTLWGTCGVHSCWVLHPVHGCLERILMQTRVQSVVRGSAPGGGRELRVYPKPATGNEGMSE